MSQTRNPLHGVITDRMAKELQLRNAARCKQAVAEMGSQWLMHADNHVTRLEAEQTPLLRFMNANLLKIAQAFRIPAEVAR